MSSVTNDVKSAAVGESKRRFPKAVFRRARKAWGGRWARFRGSRLGSGARRPRVAAHIRRSAVVRFVCRREQPDGETRP